MKPKDQTTTTQIELDEGDTAAERFKGFVKQVISVPKEEIDKRAAEWEKQQAEKRAAKSA